MAKDKPPQKQPRKSDKKSDDKTTDGAAVWQRLTAQTRPLSAAQRDRGRDKDEAAKGTQKPAKKAGNAAAPAVSHAVRGGPAMAAKRAQDKSSPLFAPSPAIDQKQRRRLSRGRTELDGTLDLHGMTLVEAEAALSGFVAYHRAQDHRWVLVITGKGVRGEGRLRKALPEWLSTPPLSQAVIEFDQAAIAHGGGGAFYLRLRRMSAPKPASSPASKQAPKPR